MYVSVMNFANNHCLRLVVHGTLYPIASAIIDGEIVADGMTTRGKS